jgi:hypothetical protein
MTRAEAVIGSIIFVIISICSSLVSFWMAYKLLKMGISILKNGYIHAGSGFFGQPEKNLDVSPVEGCFTVFCALGSLVLGGSLMIGSILLVLAVIDNLSSSL